MKKRREEDMYPAVKAFFRHALQCEKVRADLPGEEKIHLSRNLSIRDPDILGITADDEVAVAEGKLLAVSGTPFEQCVQQVESLRQFADLLYVFFPKQDWDRLSKEEAGYDKKALRERGIGLLLVDEDRRCKVLSSPPHNDTVDGAKREKVKELMGLTTDDSLPRFECLDAVAAQKANSILCYCEDVLKEVVQEVVGGKGGYYGTNKSSVGDEETPRSFFEWNKEWESGDSIDVDLFGGYLGDGQPCIWIFRSVSEKTLKEYLGKDTIRFGTHVVFWEDRRPGNKLLLRHDVNDERIAICKDRGEELFVGHKIEVVGRSQSGLKKEIECLLRQSKKLK